jgi:hypothetical protein
MTNLSTFLEGHLAYILASGPSAITKIISSSQYAFIKTEYDRHELKITVFNSSAWDEK